MSADNENNIDNESIIDTVEAGDANFEDAEAQHAYYSSLPPTLLDSEIFLPEFTLDRPVAKALCTRMDIQVTKVDNEISSYFADGKAPPIGYTSAFTSFKENTTIFYNGIGRARRAASANSSSSQVLSDADLLGAAFVTIEDFNEIMSEAVSYRPNILRVLNAQARSESLPSPAPTPGLASPTIPNPTDYTVPKQGSTKVLNLFLPVELKVDKFIVGSPAESGTDRTVNAIRGCQWDVDTITEPQIVAVAELLKSAAGPNRQEQHELFSKVINLLQADKVLHLSIPKCGAEDFTAAFNGGHDTTSTTSRSPSSDEFTSTRYSLSFGASASRPLQTPALRLVPDLKTITSIDMAAEVIQVKNALLASGFDSEHWTAAVSPANPTTGGVTLTFTPSITLYRELYMRSVVSKRLLAAIVVVMDKVTDKKYKLTGRVVQVLEKFLLARSTDLETVLDFDHADKFTFFAFLCWELFPSVSAGFSAITQLRAALHDKFGENFFSCLGAYVLSLVRDPEQPVSDWRRQVRLAAQNLSQQQTPCGKPAADFNLDIPQFTSEITQSLGLLCSLHAEQGYDPVSTDLGRALQASDWMTRTDADIGAAPAIVEDILQKVINYDDALREGKSPTDSSGGGGGGGKKHQPSNPTKKGTIGDSHAQSALSNSGSDRQTATAIAIALKVKQINGLINFAINAMKGKPHKLTPLELIHKLVKRFDSPEKVFVHKEGELVLNPNLTFVCNDISSYYRSAKKGPFKLDGKGKGQLDGIRMLLGHIDAPDYYLQSKAAQFKWGGDAAKEVMKFMETINIADSKSSSSSN
jgi:hypothetical protein